MTDAKHLLLLAHRCRYASAAFALKAREVERAAGEGASALAADLASTSIHLLQAADELTRAAIDARAPDAALLAQIAAHLATGGTVILVDAAVPAGIVVGEPDHAPAAPVAEPVRRASRWAWLNPLKWAA